MQLIYIVNLDIYHRSGSLVFLRVFSYSPENCKVSDKNLLPETGTAGKKIECSRKCDDN
jgi:hypothetical protein